MKQMTKYQFDNLTENLGFLSVDSSFRGTTYAVSPNDKGRIAFHKSSSGLITVLTKKELLEALEVMECMGV